MGRQVDQGTRHESAIVSIARAMGRKAERLAKTGTKHEADVRIEGTEMLPAIAWKRYVHTAGKRRRTVNMVVLRQQDFWKLIDKDTEADYGFFVQAKAAEKVSVSAILEGLITWIRNQQPSR